MAIPIINDWEKYFTNPHEGLGSSYERTVLNRILLDLCGRYGVRSALETPSFGFTGISGINLLALADAGIEVTLEDDDAHRLQLIADLWQRLGRPLNAIHNPGFRNLPHPERSFDLSFSFSALWFVPDLKIWLAELARVTDKVMFLSVPNRSGLGYKLQFRDYSAEKYPSLQLGNIDPPSIIALLGKLGWRLRQSGLFDCPPWPDIGMTREELLRKTLPHLPVPEPAQRYKKSQQQVSILDYYSGQDPDFVNKMNAYGWLEKIAPNWFKKIWAHHYYMVFDRDQGL